jgi:hypothetical protein
MPFGALQTFGDSGVGLVDVLAIFHDYAYILPGGILQCADVPINRRSNES